MARRWIGLAALVVALALAPAQASAATRSCRLPSGATVEAKSSFATVYRVTNGVDTVIRACLRRTNARLEVTADDDYPESVELGNVTLAGRYVGWSAVVYGRHQERWAVGSVFDLKKRRLRSRTAVAYRPGGDAPRVTDFALATTGRAAFVTHEFRVDYPEDGKPGEWRTVWALDAAGGRMLEEGPRAIDLTSLDLVGFTATWISGGQARSAQLY